MKILLINKFYYLKGGSEKHFFELKNVLEENGHDVIVFSTQNKKNIESGKNEYFIDELKMSLSNFLNGFKLFYNPQATSKLENIILNNQIDVAHIHNISHHFSPAILKVLKKHRIPIVMTVHDYKLICPNYKLFNGGGVCEKCQGGKFYNCTLNKCVKNSYLASLVMTLEAYWVKWKKYYDCIDIFIAPSRFVESKLIAGGLDKNKIKYLPNFLKRDEILKDVNKNNSEDYILSFGRLSKEKGLDTLIKALAKIEDKKIKLKIAGEGDVLERLKELAQENKISQRVEFIGYKPNREIQTLIENSKFVVTPSIWYENAPYSILESYLHKKAVIGAEIGGIGELVISGETGVTFEAGNDIDLAQKIDALLKKPDEAKIMGKNGAEMVINKLDEKNYYNKLLSIYNRLKK